MPSKRDWVQASERLPDDDQFMLAKVLNTNTNAITIENAYLHAKYRCWVMPGGVLVENQWRTVVAWRDPLAPYEPKNL